MSKRHGELGIREFPQPGTGRLPVRASGEGDALGKRFDGKMKAIEERVIVIDPDVMNGMPCFRGTRVPFKNLIDYLEGGHSLGEFLFPSVTRERAVRSLEEAKDSLLAEIA